jgi:hypothetical protein
VLERPSDAASESTLVLASKPGLEMSSTGVCELVSSLTMDARSSCDARANKVSTRKEENIHGQNLSDLRQKVGSKHGVDVQLARLRHSAQLREETRQRPTWRALTDRSGRRILMTTSCWKSLLAADVP